MPTVTWARAGLTYTTVKAFDAPGWDPGLHPRDRRGRFIETGATVRLWGGGSGTVVRNAGNGRVEVERDNGQRTVVHRNYITVTGGGAEPASTSSEETGQLVVQGRVVRPGMRFAHARQIVGSPAAGTARPDVNTVTAVRGGTVYYRNESGYRARSDRDSFPRVVGSWVDDDQPASAAPPDQEAAASATGGYTSADVQGNVARLRIGGEFRARPTASTGQAKYQRYRVRRVDSNKLVGEARRRDDGAWVDDQGGMYASRDEALAAIANRASSDTPIPEPEPTPEPGPAPGPQPTARMERDRRGELTADGNRIGRVTQRGRWVAELYGTNEQQTFRTRREADNWVLQRYDEDPQVRAGMPPTPPPPAEVTDRYIVDRRTGEVTLTESGQRVGGVFARPDVGTFTAHSVDPELHRGGFETRGEALTWIDRMRSDPEAAAGQRLDLAREDWSAARRALTRAREMEASDERITRLQHELGETATAFLGQARDAPRGAVARRMAFTLPAEGDDLQVLVAKRDLAARRLGEADSGDQPDWRRVVGALDEAVAERRPPPPSVLPEEKIDAWGDRASEIRAAADLTRLLDPSLPDVERKQAARDVWDGFTHGGVTSRVTTVSLNPDGGGVVHGELLDADGNPVGMFQREILRSTEDQPARVWHHGLKITNPELRGQGFATAFNRRAENAYIRAGIKSIRLGANSTIGGFAWARSGYDFVHEDGRRNAAYGVRAAVRDERRDLQERQEEHGEDHAQQVAELRRMESYLDRVASGEEHPTAYELSQMGRREGDTTWPGKTGMLGSSWQGVKRMVPPPQPRSAPEPVPGSQEPAPEPSPVPLEPPAPAATPEQIAALNDPATRGGDGPLSGGYSEGQRVWTLGGLGNTPGLMEIAGPVTNTYDRERDRRVMIRALGEENAEYPPTPKHIEEIYPEMGRVWAPPTVGDVEPTLAGVEATAMTPESLGIDERTLAWLRRTVKADRVQLDSKKWVNDKSYLHPGVVRLNWVKDHALTGIGERFGFTPEETSEARGWLNDAINSWTVQGGLRERRVEMHEATKHLRAGGRADTPQRRGMLLQKTWSDLTWREHYGNRDRTDVSRFVQGKYASRLAALKNLEDSGDIEPGAWEVDAWPLSSWAVASAADRVRRDWIGKDRFAVRVDREIGREEAWLNVWGEGSFRTAGLKAPGEIVVDDRAELSPRTGLTLEVINPGEERRPTSQAWAAYLRQYPDATVEDIAAGDALRGERGGSFAVPRFLGYTPPDEPRELVRFDRASRTPEPDPEALAELHEAVEFARERGYDYDLVDQVRDIAFRLSDSAQTAAWFERGYAPAYLGYDSRMTREKLDRYRGLVTGEARREARKLSTLLGRYSVDVSAEQILEAYRPEEETPDPLHYVPIAEVVRE